jgi:hypothetical protein
MNESAGLNANLTGYNSAAAARVALVALRDVLQVNRHLRRRLESRSDSAGEQYTTSILATSQSSCRKDVVWHLWAAQTPALADGLTHDSGELASM